MSVKSTKLGPYRLLMVLLYGRHKWIERSGGRIRVPVARVSSHLRTRAHRINEYLEDLEKWGFVTYCRWSKYYCTVELACPAGMAWVMNDAGNMPVHQTEAVDVEG